MAFGTIEVACYVVAGYMPDQASIAFVPTPDALGVASPQTTPFTLTYVANFLHPPHVVLTAPNALGDLYFDCWYAWNWKWPSVPFGSTTTSIALDINLPTAGFAYCFYSGYFLGIGANSVPAGLAGASIVFTPTPDHIAVTGPHGYGSQYSLQNSPIWATPVPMAQGIHWAANTVGTLTAPLQVVQGLATYYFDHWVDPTGASVYNEVLPITKAAAAEQATAWYVLTPTPTASSLHATRHFGGAVLLADVGLSGDEAAISRISPRGAWRDRIVVPDSAGLSAANVTASNSALDFVDDKASLRSRRSRDLAKDWKAASTIQADCTHLTAYADGHYLCATALDSGNQYFLRWDRDEAHALADGPHLIAPSDSIPAGITPVDGTKAIICAVEQSDTVKLYRSDDQGRTWTLVQTLADMHWPALTTLNNRVLLVVSYEFPQKNVPPNWLVFYSFRGSSELLPQLLNTGIGFADSGRPAIYANPRTWQLSVYTGKLTDWGTGDPTPAIIEYRSADAGRTWDKYHVQAV